MEIGDRVIKINTKVKGIITAVEKYLYGNGIRLYHIKTDDGFYAWVYPGTIKRINDGNQG